MKRLLCLLLVLVGCHQKAKEDVLIVGTNPTYPPFEYIEKGKPVGFDVDLAEIIAQRLGKKLELKLMDFDALILSLKHGRVDLVLAGMSITDSREREIIMIPYQGEVIDHLYFAVLDEQSEIKSVAAQVGSLQEEYVKRLNVKCKALESIGDLIMELKYKKSDAICLEPAVARQFPELTLKRIDLEQPILGNGIGIKKENTELAAKIDAVIAELKAEGVIHDLEQKWGLI